MWKFIVDVVHDFVSSLQPDVGRGFLHVSNVFLLLSLIFPKWADIFTEKKITCSPYCLEDAYASLGFA